MGSITVVNTKYGGDHRNLRLWSSGKTSRNDTLRTLKQEAPTSASGGGSLRVDLPLPDSPVINTNSPFLILKVTPLRTIVPCLNFFFTLINSIIISPYPKIFCASVSVSISSAQITFTFSFPKYPFMILYACFSFAD